VNDRERFLATMRYEPRDRCVIWDFGFWDECFPLYHKNGLPADVTDNGKASRFFGMDPEGGVGVPIDIVPGFESEVLKEDANYKWVRDDNGVTRIHHKHSTTIPEPVEFLLKDRASWNEHFKRRFNPDDPARHPADFARNIAKHRDADRTCPLYVGAGSLYGRIRDMIGFENLALLLYDDRALVEEMVEVRADCIVKPLAWALEIAKKQGVTFDYASMWEDICFNRGPQISPTMFREICGPHYRRITDLLAKYGCKIVQLDCDGKIDDLIPTWLDNGVNCMFPIEIGDWADPIAMRGKWGRGLLLRGGFDKHILSEGPKEISVEVKRLTPLVEEGGFIPHCDHRVPADVSLANYVFYVEEAKRVWGKGLPNLRPMGKLTKA